MEKETNKEEKLKKENYSKPEITKHDPVKVVQGSDDSCSLYYTTLYYS